MTCLYVENDREIWTENMNVVFESLRAYQNKSTCESRCFYFGSRRLIFMLGGSQFRLRQGFRLWRKHLYGA